MEEQTYPPKRASMVFFGACEEQQSRNEWKAQFDRMLEEYRNQYVLHRHPDEKLTR